MNKENFIKYRFLAKVARQNHTERFLKQRNIVGISYGRRTVGGKITDEPAVVVYVIKKVNKGRISPSHLLPRKIFIGGDCIHVDVVETGPLYPLSFTANERPAPSGISVGHFNITAGTLGCLVNDLTDNSLCILSNNHVMANENAAAMGDNILQPGPADGGSDPGDAIATLKRFVTIGATGNTIDAAIAQLIKSSFVVDQMKDNLMPVPSADHPAVGLLFAGGATRTILNPINDVLTALNIQFTHGPNATVAPDLDMIVEKVGRTTEYTSGKIMEIDATVTIAYDFGNATFDHQIVTNAISCPGDSGSIVCRGGSGQTAELNCDSGCLSTAAVQSLLNRDVKEEVQAEKIFREEHFSSTLTGRYLLDTYFANESTIVERLDKVRKDRADVEYLQHLDKKYASIVREVISNPEKSKLTFSGEHIAEFKQLLGRLSNHLSRDEKDAVKDLFEIAQSMEGMNIKEILKMLNDKKVYNNVVKVISGVESMKKQNC